MLYNTLLQVSLIPQCFEKGYNRELYMQQFLLQKIPELNCDDIGNLYLINEGTPLICAHMDTVGSEKAQEKLKKLKRDGDKLLSGANVGFDDKAGIALALELYKKFGNKISLLFTVQEETGMVGSRHFVEKHSDLLKKCTYCLVGDRKGNNDIGGFDNDYCSKEFQDDLKALPNLRKYKLTRVGCSDCNNISEVINCVNISVGYYNAHMDTEYLNIKEFNNAYVVFTKIIKQLIPKEWKTYEQENPPKKYEWNSYKGGTGFTYRGGGGFTYSDRGYISGRRHSNVGGVSMYRNINNGKIITEEEYSFKYNDDVDEYIDENDLNNYLEFTTFGDLKVTEKVTLENINGKKITLKPGTYSFYKPKTKNKSIKTIDEFKEEEKEFINNWGYY